MNPTILVVDDDANNRKLLTDLLAIKGYGVLEAADGAVGTELARRCAPGLVLMDLRMPVMDGFEALRILRDDPQTRPLAIWALTSYALRDDENQVRTLGFDEYLTKPLDLRNLLARIARHFENRAPHPQADSPPQKETCP